MEGSASKTVRNQLATGKSVISAAETHGDAMAKALFERQRAADDKKLSEEDFQRVFRWQIAEMRAANDRMWDAEMTYTGEQGDDAGVAEARDRSGAALDDALRTARNSAMQLGGRDALQAFGMASPPPADMNGLARYADNAVKLLRQHTTTLHKAGLAFDPSAVADSLAPMLDQWHPQPNPDFGMSFAEFLAACSTSKPASSASPPTKSNRPAWAKRRSREGTRKRSAGALPASTSRAGASILSPASEVDPGNAPRPAHDAQPRPRPKPWCQAFGARASCPYHPFRVRLCNLAAFTAIL